MVNPNCNMGLNHQVFLELCFNLLQSFAAVRFRFANDVSG